MNKWNEYFCITPMCESEGMISAETLGRICLALGKDYVVCQDDRGGIGFGRLNLIPIIPVKAEEEGGAK